VHMCIVEQLVVCADVWGVFKRCEGGIICKILDNIRVSGGGGCVKEA
jgi:hypothetical protein